VSSYVVGAETLGRVVAHIEHANTFASRHLCDELTRLLGLPSGERWHIELGRALHDMNVSAVCQRYTDDSPGDYPYEHPRGHAPSLLHAYKALRCYLYQCSEGDVPLWTMYQMLVDYADHLANAIVQAMPEYDALPWG
jgi:hypothetical protein